MAFIKGTWRWNDTFDTKAFIGSWNVNFICNGTHYHRIVCSLDQDERGYDLFYYNQENQSYTWVCQDGSNWYHTIDYQTITFVGTQEVDDVFDIAFRANAVRKPGVTYNSKSTALPDGQTATLNCAGKKAITDIELYFSNGGSITYNGTETEIEAGKTATLACKGKKMKSDVSVTVWQEPGLYDADGNSVATWSRLTSDYGMNVSGNYNPDGADWEGRKEGHPASILAENAELSSGTKLVIPGTVNYIGMNTFQSSNLTEVVILSGTYTIAQGAFSFSNNLNKVVIPGSVKTIGTNAFWHCKGLSDVTLSSGVTEIGLQAFAECENLKSIALPVGLKSIKAGAFENCPLSSITLPDGLETIGSLAFQGCQATSVTIPKSVKELGNGVFASCQQMQDIIVEEGNEQYKSETFTGDDGEEHRYLVDLPSTTLIQFPGGYRGHFEVPTGFVRVFGYSFFETLVTDVTIPDTLENIEEFAFAGSYNFNLLELPQNILSIGAWAFRNCASLCGKYDNEQGEYALNVLSENLETISEGAFVGCSGLINIYFENGLPKIEADAFLRCSNLMSISIPDTVTEIGESILGAVSDGFQFIFRGTQELWEQVVVGAENESWLDKLVFWD